MRKKRPRGPKVAFGPNDSPDDTMNKQITQSDNTLIRNGHSRNGEEGSE